MFDNYLDELSRATRTNGSKNCPNCGAPIETKSVLTAELCFSTSQLWMQTSRST